MTLAQADRANGTVLHLGNADALVTVVVSEDMAGVWTEMRPELVANVLRDIADDLNTIAVRRSVPLRTDIRP